MSRRTVGRGAALALGLAATAAPLRIVGAVDPSSGAAVDARFSSFYDRFGGEAVVGAPLTEAFQRNGRWAQIFDNFLLEHWPEHEGTSYAVQPAFLGVVASGARYFTEIPAFRGSDQVHYIPETRHSLRFGFLDFWEQAGGLELLGHPISEEVPDDGLTAQWFQRAKLSFDSTRTDPIRLEPIGREYLDSLTDGLDAGYAVAAGEPVSPGEPSTLEVTLTNEGSAVWPAAGTNAVSLGFRWSDPFEPADRPTPPFVSLPGEVHPGASVSVSAQIPAVGSAGQFRIQPDLKQAGEWFTAQAIQAPIADVPAVLATPEMRVGLLDISDDNPGVERATITSTGGLSVRDEGGVLLAALNQSDELAIFRDIPRELQVITLPGDERVETVGRVLITPDEGSMLQLEETHPWHTYRGRMEFVWLPSYQAAWVVNFLPMEDYLAGIAEQGDHIPDEALRASAIAFRSYAYVTREERRANNLLFDAAGSTHHTPTMYTRHQVYHGFARELSGTRLREVVEATRGMVAMYDDEPIMSVYFSRADGRTRSWHEVWGGALKPWAIGVPDPYSEGQQLLGHGIGLPLRSANAMAADGANAEQILTSYYTGIDFGFAY